MKNTLLLLCLVLIQSAFGQSSEMQFALLKYSGGGDWYANPSAMTNLILFANATLGTNIDPEYEVTDASSPDLFNYPLVHMTGHGNVVFSETEQRNLKLYLEAGGFLHIDDNYGMDQFIRPELQKLLPESELVPLPADHALFSAHFDFPKGLPKIHEHDRQAPQAYGLFIEGRMAVLYTYESDLSDGWEDPEVHNDPPDVREKALKMGVNIISYVFSETDS